MIEDRNRQDENTVKVLFFILTRIDGKSQRISMNQEAIQHDERHTENHNRLCNR